MPGRSHIVVIALEGVTDAVRAAIDRSLADGLAVLLITDTRKEQAAAEALSSILMQSDLRIVSVRVRTMRWMRDRVSRQGLKAVRAIETFIYRVFRFTGHRMPISDNGTSTLLRMGTRVSAATARIGESLLSKVIDPLVLLLGLAVYRPREINQVRSHVRELVSTNLVLAVLCLDSASLLPGWSISRTLPGVPVLTEYPSDWSIDVVARVGRLAGGSIE